MRRALALCCALGAFLALPLHAGEIGVKECPTLNKDIRFCATSSPWQVEIQRTPFGDMHLLKQGEGAWWILVGRIPTPQFDAHFEEQERQLGQPIPWEPLETMGKTGRALYDPESHAVSWFFPLAGGVAMVGTGKADNRNMAEARLRRAMLHVRLRSPGQ